MKYMILIEVPDDRESESAYPKWKHDLAAEAHLSDQQRFVVEALYRAYHAVQKTLNMEEEAKRASEPRLRIIRQGA